MAAFVLKSHIIYSLAVNPLPSNPVYRFTKKVPSIFTLILCSRHVLHLLSLQAVSYSTHVSLSSSVSVLSSPQARFDPHHSQTLSSCPCLCPCFLSKSKSWWWKKVIWCHIWSNNIRKLSHINIYYSLLYYCRQYKLITLHWHLLFLYNSKYDSSAT